MIDRAHDLPVAKQAEVLNMSRGSVYYRPRPVPQADLAIMHRLRVSQAHSLEGHMCGTAMRGADALPGSKATSRAKGSHPCSGLGFRSRAR